MKQILIIAIICLVLNRTKFVTKYWKAEITWSSQYLTNLSSLYLSTWYTTMMTTNTIFTNQLVYFVVGDYQSFCWFPTLLVTSAENSSRLCNKQSGGYFVTGTYVTYSIWEPDRYIAFTSPLKYKRLVTLTCMALYGSLSPGLYLTVLESSSHDMPSFHNLCKWNSGASGW